MYDALITALKATQIPVAEGDWDRAPQSGSYITVRLEFEHSALWGDGHQLQQAMEGSVHLFCRNADQGEMEMVQVILDELETSWELNSIQYEPRNGIVHYEWIFRLEQLTTPERVI